MRICLKKFEGPDPDLAALAQEYQQFQQRGCFHSEIGHRIRQRLPGAKGEEI